MCTHKWHILSKDILDSPYEQVAKSNHDGFYGSIQTSAPNFFQKKIVIIAECQNCGELQKFVEVNPQGLQDQPPAV